MSGEDLTVAVERRDDLLCATLRGELDLATVAQLEVELPSPHRGDTLIIDLQELSFIDSMGVRAVMQLDLTARAEHWSVVLVGARGHVKRVLELCYVHQRISMVDDPAEVALLARRGDGPGIRS